MGGCALINNKTSVVTSAACQIRRVALPLPAPVPRRCLLLHGVDRSESIACSTGSRRQSHNAHSRRPAVQFNPASMRSRPCTSPRPSRATSQKPPDSLVSGQSESTTGPLREEFLEPSSSVRLETAQPLPERRTRDAEAGTDRTRVLKLAIGFDPAQPKPFFPFHSASSFGSGEGCGVGGNA